MHRIYWQNTELYYRSKTTRTAQKISLHTGAQLWPTHSNWSWPVWKKYFCAATKKRTPLKKQPTKQLQTKPQSQTWPAYHFHRSGQLKQLERGAWHNFVKFTSHVKFSTVLLLLDSSVQSKGLFIHGRQSWWVNRGMPPSHYAVRTEPCTCPDCFHQKIPQHLMNSPLKPGSTFGRWRRNNEGSLQPSQKGISL